MVPTCDHRPVVGSRYTARDIIIAWAIGAPLLGLITFVRAVAGDTNVSEAALYGVIVFAAVTVGFGLFLLFRLRAGKA